MTGSQRSRPISGAVDPTVYTITDAGTSHSDDLNSRINKYLVSMAIRTACVILAVIVHDWLRWVFIAGAVGLPYVAVLLANARNQRRPPRATAVPPDLYLQGEGRGDPDKLIYMDEPMAHHPNGG